MKPRTIIGIIFIVASLLKLATLWGIIHWSWFETLSEGPWAMYLSIFVLLYVGAQLVVDSYRRDPDQWLRRPLPISEDGRRICCSVHYGGDEYVYHGETFAHDGQCGGEKPKLHRCVGNHAKGKVNSTAPTLHIIASNLLGGVDIKN